MRLKREVPNKPCAVPPAIAPLGLVLSLLLICAPTMAADGWALSTSKRASRQVVVTLFIGSRQIEKWTLPVAHDAPAVEEYIQSRWITLPREPAKGLPRKIFTDTWLGSVDADEAWVRIAWWPDRNRDARNRLTNSYIATAFRSTQTLELEEDMRVVVSYEDKG